MTSRWISYLSILVLFLAFYLKYPQPDFDLVSFAELASLTVNADTHSIQNGMPLDGVVIAITGATSGIGYGLADNVLHSLGATILAIGRSRAKLARLREHLNNTRIQAYEADLTDLSSVAKAADEIAYSHDRVDYLVNNAGIHYTNDVILKFWKEHSTPAGYDVAFSANYLAHFLLTEKMIPLLEASERPSPRIIQVTSSFHWLSDGTDLAIGDDGSPPWASFGDAKSFFHRERAYANSKLAQILHARALSRRLENKGSRVRVVSACPGWVATNVGGEGINKLFLSMLAYPSQKFGLTSTLTAMFSPEAGKEGMDFYVNSPFFDYLGAAINKLGMSGKNWPSAIGFRDALSWTAAILLLWLQKFESSCQSSTSSPESYNVAAQDNLFEWSLRALSAHR